ncbi:MAG: 30S ribosomal protein S8 [bacterium]|nr:30S ribosomal protein S8 [bacterium]
MSMQDPISDLLTRVRNAARVEKERADIPFSNIKREIAKILVKEGYVKDFKVLRINNRKTLRLFLKHRLKRERIISGIKRISRPGLRVYAKADDVPRVLGGLGIAILSTSSGLMTGKECRKARVGGEVLCYVW